jgi:DnaJ-class molecular chaperone
MSLYERLGLSKGADSSEIRRAYLKLSKTEHPDKGGSAETFKTLQQAYEVLSNDQSRAYYDQTGQIPGEEGQMQQGPPGGMPFPFPFDIGGMFGGMFGGGMRREPVRKQQKAPPKIHEIALTLSDFFYGKQFDIKFERQTFCTQCKGEGAERFESCAPCGGAGVRESHVMIGPGMAAVSRSQCDVCGGQGKRPVGTCSKCRGTKFTNQEKTLKITIEPGMVPGDVMKFMNECSDNHAYEEPGDVHIILREADETSSISRFEENLLTNHTISLSEALLGTTILVKGHPGHPNGLTVEIPAGTMRGDTITVAGEGMPCRGTTRRGKLQVAISLDVKKEEKEKLIANKELLSSLFN